MTPFEKMKQDGMRRAGELGHVIPGYMDYVVGKTEIGIGHCANRCSTWVVVCYGDEQDLIDGPSLVYDCSKPKKKGVGLS